MTDPVGTLTPDEPYGTRAQQAPAPAGQHASFPGEYWDAPVTERHGGRVLPYQETWPSPSVDSLLHRESDLAFGRLSSAFWLLFESRAEQERYHFLSGRARELGPWDAWFVPLSTAPRAGDNCSAKR